MSFNSLLRKLYDVTYFNYKFWTIQLFIAISFNKGSISTVDSSTVKNFASSSNESVLVIGRWHDVMIKVSYNT